VIINRITAIGLLIFASVCLGGTVFPQTPKKTAPKRPAPVKPAPQEDTPLKDTFDEYKLEDEDASIIVTRIEDVKGRARDIFIGIVYRIASSDREAAQNDVFLMGGDFQESRKVNAEVHEITIDASGNIRKYEVEYKSNGRLVAKRDLLTSYTWVAKPIQERGIKYHQRALEKGQKESVR
jgi:hypothetical protein